MIKWLKTWWRPVRIEYRPESKFLGEINAQELKAMWPEIAQAYDNHQVIFAYIKWLCTKLEAKANQPAPISGDAKEDAEWIATKRDVCSKLDALRSILYAPRLANAILEDEKRKKEEEIPVDPNEYWNKQPFIPN